MGRRKEGADVSREKATTSNVRARAGVPRAPKSAKCANHPSKRATRRGMCESCYRAWWRRQDPAAFRAKRRARYAAERTKRLAAAKRYYHERIKKNPRMLARRRAASAAWARTANAKARAVGYWLRSRYGLTVEGRTKMLAAQRNRCALCPRSLTVRTAHIDHDHACARGRGSVRGLLCRACNVALGMFGDSPSRLRGAAAYLERHRRAR